MDAYWIITAFVVIDTLMERLGHRSDVRAKVPDSEILTIAVVAAKYFGSHLPFAHRLQCAAQVLCLICGAVEPQREKSRLQTPKRDPDIGKTIVRHE